MTKLNHLESLQPGYCDFSLLKYRPIFTIGLSASHAVDVDSCSFIANGRFVSSHELEVWILDDSELAESVRTRPIVSFDVDLQNGRLLCGAASVKLGSSRVGPNNKRFIETVLLLQNAYESDAILPLAKWLT